MPSESGVAPCSGLILNSISSMIAKFRNPPNPCCESRCAVLRSRAAFTQLFPYSRAGCERLVRLVPVRAAAVVCLCCLRRNHIRSNVSKFASTGWRRWRAAPSEAPAPPGPRARSRPGPASRASQQPRQYQSQHRQGLRQQSGFRHFRFHGQGAVPGSRPTHRFVLAARPARQPTAAAPANTCHAWSMAGLLPIAGSRFGLRAFETTPQGKCAPHLSGRHCLARATAGPGCGWREKKCSRPSGGGMARRHAGLDGDRD